MKYIHQKIAEAKVDSNKITIENKTNPFETKEVRSSCGSECFLIFGILLLICVSYF